MPCSSKVLPVSVIKATPVGKTIAVGGVTGLYFRKTKYQSLFLLRFKDQTGRHDLSIGTYPEMSLAEARDKAADLRRRISQGEDVLGERRELREQAAREKEEALVKTSKSPKLTFAAIATDWVNERARFNYWAHDDSGELRTMRILEMHVFPYIGSKNINDITPEDVFNVLSKIWTAKFSTASKAKTYIFKVFQWAMAKKLCQSRENPADSRYSLGVLMEPLQRHAQKRTHFAACSFVEIPQFFVQSARYGSISARACEFAILTCARSQAVRMACWDEIDFEKRIWTIPLSHDKIKLDGRDRRIFLSDQAIELLRSLPRFPGSNVIFPNQRGHALSDAALTMFLRGMHEARFARDGRGWVDPHEKNSKGEPAVITLHGTARATFRTWAKDDVSGNNRRFDQEAVELCLLHAKNDMYRGAYDRSRLDRERQLIMTTWGAYCVSQKR